MATPHIVVQIRTRHNQWDPTFLFRVETPSGGYGGNMWKPFGDSLVELVPGVGGHANRWPVDGEPGQPVQKNSQPQSNCTNEMGVLMVLETFSQFYCNENAKEIHMHHT